MNRRFVYHCLALLIAAATVFHGAESAELFPTDSRSWARAGNAVVATDFSKVGPAGALITGRREKGKWKLIPFETAEWKGTALSAYAQTGPPAVRLPLAARGWHAVYVGLATTSGGFGTGGNGMKARLSDEPVFKRMACNLALLSNRRGVIQEQFLTVAELKGQSVEIAPLPGLPATVCYVKLVPLTAEEARNWTASRTAPLMRTSIATFDGHSWIWPYRPRSAAELQEEFRGFEDSDIGKWWFQVCGADLVCYPSKVGNIPGEGTTDFPSSTYAAYTRTLQDLFKKGINPLRVAREAARAQGVEFHVMLRPAGWKGSMPYEETFNSRFFDAHPEWRCVDRDGTPTFYMSYAVPEVRRHLLKILRETLALQPEGVGFLFNRGMPMMLWEEAFCKRFRERHQADAREVAEDDPRILATRAEIMTEFMAEVRALLDETARAQGRKARYKISLGTFSREADNRKFGFDLPLWIKRGLVDELAVAWFAYHTSFAPPDMAYYRRITAGTKVGVCPFVIAWKTGKPQELCKKVADYYAAGASGIAIWDPQVHRGWPEGSPGNAFDVLGRLGDRDRIARWAKNGVPQPLTIPLTRLDDNYFSRWFPNTGF
ncbi:MAG: hypothetical protein HZC54_05795 [Verrucomicrobia bacterium]|nr:hypothetical protein [Verrucomicrobiota bacterium]